MSDNRDPVVAANAQLNQLRRSRVPLSFVAATWRGTVPADDRHQELGISFDLPEGQVIRLRLSITDAVHVSESLATYIADHYARIQSLKSSEISSVLISTPDE